MRFCQNGLPQHGRRRIGQRVGRALVTHACPAAAPVKCFCAFVQSPAPSLAKDAQHSDRWRATVRPPMSSRIATGNDPTLTPAPPRDALQDANPWNGRGEAGLRTCCTSRPPRVTAMLQQVSGDRCGAGQACRWSWPPSAPTAAAHRAATLASASAGPSHGEQGQEQQQAGGSDRTGVWNGPAPRGYVSEPMHVSCRSLNRCC